MEDDNLNLLSSTDEEEDVPVAPPPPKVKEVSNDRYFSEFYSTDMKDPDN